MFKKYVFFAVQTPKSPPFSALSALGSPGVARLQRSDLPGLQSRARPVQMQPVWSLSLGVHSTCITWEMSELQVLIIQNRFASCSSASGWLVCYPIHVQWVAPSSAFALLWPRDSHQVLQGPSQSRTAHVTADRCDVKGVLGSMVFAISLAFSKDDASST